MDIVVADLACRKDGSPRPLRQTIVIIDEAAIEPRLNGKVNDTNLRINTEILTIAGMLDKQNAVVSAPRERLTILFAREDGKDLMRVFTGCAPTYTDDEVVNMEKSYSDVERKLNWFFGSSAAARIEKEKLAFRSSLLKTMVELANFGGGKKQFNDTKRE